MKWLGQEELHEEIGRRQPLVRRLESIRSCLFSGGARHEFGSSRFVSFFCELLRRPPSRSTHSTLELFLFLITLPVRTSHNSTLKYTRGPRSRLSSPITTVSRGSWTSLENFCSELPRFPSLPGSTELRFSTDQSAAEGASTRPLLASALNYTEAFTGSTEAI
jgi:hypothetical protein